MPVEPPAAPGADSRAPRDGSRPAPAVTRELPAPIQARAGSAAQADGGGGSTTPMPRLLPTGAPADGMRSDGTGSRASELRAITRGPAPPRGDTPGPAGSPPSPAPPIERRDERGSARRRSGLQVALLVTVVVLLVSLAAAVSYAVVAGQRADDAQEAVDAWEARVRDLEDLVDEQLQREAELAEQIETLSGERDLARTELDVVREEGEDLRRALADANDRLAAAEERLAARAGIRANARDEALLGG